MRRSIAVMRTILAIAAIGLSAVATARAGWTNLKVGMDQEAAYKAAGMPLMQIYGHGCGVWTYDRSGYIQFQSGRVAYWEAPKVPERSLPRRAAVARAIRKSPVQVKTASPFPNVRGPKVASN